MKNYRFNDKKYYLFYFRQNYSDKCGYDRSHSKTKPFAIETTEDEVNTL